MYIKGNYKQGEKAAFIVQKLLNLIKSHLFIFAFISITLGGGS